MPKQYETMTCSVAGPDLPSTDSASEHLQNRHSRLPRLTDPLEHLELCVQYKQGNRDPATPLHETIVDFLCNTMGAHGQQVSTAHPNLMGFTGSRVWMDMDGYKTDANGYGKRDSAQSHHWRPTPEELDSGEAGSGVERASCCWPERDLRHIGATHCHTYNYIYIIRRPLPPAGGARQRRPY